MARSVQPVFVQSKRTSVSGDGPPDSAGPSEPGLGSGIQWRTVTQALSGASVCDDVELDEQFSLLRARRRRYALYYLQREESATLGGLAGQLAAWENSIDPEAVSYVQRKRVYTSLQQTHLPRMDDLGVVEFDSRTGAVSLTSAGAEIEVYPQAVEMRNGRWAVLYLAVGLVNAALLLLLAAGLPVPGELSQSGLAAFVVSSFLVVTLAHITATRAEGHGRNGPPPERTSRE